MRQRRVPEYIGDVARIITQMPSPTVISVNISPGGIPKMPMETGDVMIDGLRGDGHNHAKHRTPLSAITIIDVEDLDDLRREGFNVFPGATGENLTVRDLDVDGLAVGDRLQFTGGVLVEITKHRHPCYVLDAISPELKRVIVGRCGVLAKVLREGEVRAGETIEIIRAENTALLRA
jgi:MOSC domain-containing protein YiiM